MRIALVHDWLTGMRGGEKVLSLLCGLVPGADILTLIHVPGSCDDAIERRCIRTSDLSDLPGVGRYYRHLLPLMPLAIEQIDASGYDLIISSSHCVAKGVIRSPGSLHVCYCHTPMRYAWAQQSAYRTTMGLGGLALRLMRPYLRAWDRRSAGHVDCFVANSRNVAGRIAASYRRSAEVIYPPIDTDFLTPADVPREPYYVMVTAMAPYKRVDQAIEAFGQLARKLIIIGAGQQLAKLRKSAPANVELLGWGDDEMVRYHYRRCQALIFPGEEDFGMTPLEAMACGCPVIAYGAGGAMETVLDAADPANTSPTGLLYRPQTVEGLVGAVQWFEHMGERFDPAASAAWAGRFGRQRFVNEFRELLAEQLAQRNMAPLAPAERKV
ncbi:MAG: glycosyltransferase [Planctomycetota bacterium]|jgi:glycosyltransferase involved in cell wall biosynthesis